MNRAQMFFIRKANRRQRLTKTVVEGQSFFQNRYCLRKAVPTFCFDSLQPPFMKTTALIFSLLLLPAFSFFAQDTTKHMLLPENLAFFTATRYRTTVSLQWQTVNENNSKGFVVQRKTSGSWVQVAFLPSNSGGSSSARVSYGYSEVNAFKGVTQYRVAEVTNGGKQKWSEIRAVRAESQAGRLSLYPNPSYDGRVTLVFDNATLRDVTVTNLTGFPVKQIAGLQATTLQLENMDAGWYTLRITEKATNEVFLERFIVSR